MMGCHSVIDNPESVSRVAPPTRTMAAMRNATQESQTRSAPAWRAGIVSDSNAGDRLCVVGMLIGAVIAGSPPELNGADGPLGPRKEAT